MLKYRQNQHIACARWLCHFNIPSLIPDDGGVSYRDIAEKAHIPEYQLRKVCRMAMTSGLFRELDNHTLEHTAISKDLRQGSPFLHAMTFLTETASITANKMVDMTKQYGSSSAQNHTAFNIAFDTDLPFYAYSSKDPKLSTQLAGSMKFFGVGGELHLKHLVNGYDWESLGDAKVVDVSFQCYICVCGNIDCNFRSVVHKVMPASPWHPRFQICPSLFKTYQKSLIEPRKPERRAHRTQPLLPVSHSKCTTSFNHNHHRLIAQMSSLHGLSSITGMIMKLRPFYATSCHL